MDAAMAATIALKEQTKNRMNFETGYLFCHVETKNENPDIFSIGERFGFLFFSRMTIPDRSKRLCVRNLIRKTYNKRHNCIGTVR